LSFSILKNTGLKSKKKNPEHPAIRFFFIDLNSHLWDSQVLSDSRTIFHEEKYFLIFPILFFTLSAIKQSKLTHLLKKKG